jgi:hypothetical protein
MDRQNGKRRIYDDSRWSDQDEHANLVPEHEYHENDEIYELDSLADSPSSRCMNPFGGFPAL